MRARHGVLALLLALVLAQSAWAAEWTIGRNPAGDYPTLRWALQDTSNVTLGDTLTFLAGQVHRVGTNQIQSPVRHRMVVRGEYPDVVIRGTADGYAVYVKEGARGVEFRDFTVRSAKDTLAPYAIVKLTGTGIFDLCEDGLDVTFRNVRFRNIQANSSGIPHCIVAEASESPSYEHQSVRLVSCVFDSCSNTGSATNSRGPVAFEAYPRVVVDGCQFTNNSSARAPLFYLQAFADTTDYKWNFIVKNSLFAHNTATATSGTGGAAIGYFPLAAHAVFDTTRISYCTFVGNTATTPEFGQVFTRNMTHTGMVIDHCVFYGDGTTHAASEPNAGTLAAVNHVCSFNHADNRLWQYAASATDTLEADPLLRAGYVPGLLGARVTTDASYMGWRDQGNVSWLVGTGVDCDFETVALALASANVVAGDTLTLKAGQPHTVGGSAANRKANMTIMGQGDDRDAVVVRPPSAASSAFSIDLPGITLANFTVRSFLSGGTPQTQTAPLIELSTGSSGAATLDLINVRIAGVAGNTDGTVAPILDASMDDLDEDTQLRLIGCAVDSCSTTGGTTRRLISIGGVRRVVIDGSEFNLNESSGRGAIYYIAMPENALPYVLIVRNTLFNQNTAASTATGGALHWLNTSGDPENEDAGTDTTLISHCTFYKNIPGAAANGQIYWVSNNANIPEPIVTNCIFVGDGNVYAMMKLATEGNRPIATWCNTWDCEPDNHLWAQSQNDTLSLNPEFVSIHIDSPIKFMPRSCAIDGDQGSSIRVTDQTPASYMGWIDPSNVATEVPELVSPASGKVTPTLCDEAPCVEVEWNVAAYADSYAVRWGETCGEGTYDASYAEGDTTAYLGPLTQGTTYYWQVRTQDCGGWGYWSACRYFKWPLAAKVTGDRHRRGH